MSHGQYDGKTAADAEIRDPFWPRSGNAWYQERLVAKQENDVNYLTQQAEHIDAGQKPIVERRSDSAWQTFDEVQQQLEQARMFDTLKYSKAHGRDNSLEEGEGKMSLEHFSFACCTVINFHLG